MRILNFAAIEVPKPGTAGALILNALLLANRDSSQRAGEVGKLKDHRPLLENWAFTGGGEATRAPAGRGN